MEKMVKAAVLEAPGKIGFMEIPYPKLEYGDGGAIMHSIGSGICGTDKHTFKGQTKQNGGTATEFETPFPLIQGHEAVGIIEEIAPGCVRKDFYGEELRPGDRITFCPDIVCGSCYYCRVAPWYPWCEDKSRECYGQSMSANDKMRLNGAFAEYMYLYPKAYLYKVPEKLSNDLACWTEVMCVTYTLDKAKEMFAFDGEGFEFGGSVVVQGCGPLGLAHIIKAKMLGAGTIIATDISDDKLALAKAFGADITLNSLKTTSEERIDIVRQATHGFGANVVCETAGVPGVVQEGLEMVRKCGVYLEPGHFVDVGPDPVNFHLICAKDIRIVGMNNHAVTGYRPTMEMMLRHEKDFPWEKIFTHHFKLSQYEEAMQAALSPESMKVIVNHEWVK